MPDSTVSTLYAPLGVTAAFAVLTYVLRSVWFVEKSGSAPAVHTESGIKSAVTGGKKS